MEEPKKRSALWGTTRAPKQRAPRLPIDSSKINVRTGRLEAPRLPAESIGSVHIYTDHFGSLCTGSARAIITGKAVLFSDGIREYSLEALPGGFAFLFNTADASDAVQVSDSLDTLPPTAGPRARALLPALSEALKGLGFEVPST